MSLFEKRPLALAVCILAAVSFTGAYLSGVCKLICLSVLPILSIIIIKLLRRRNIRLICGIPPTYFIIVTSVLVLLSLLSSIVFFDAYAAGYEALGTRTARGVVVDIESSSAYGSVYAVRLERVDGEPMRAKGLLGLEGASGLSIGDVIEVKTEFCPLEEFYDYENASRVGMLADGFVFSGNAAESINIIGEKNTIEVALSSFKSNLSARLSLFLRRDTAAFADGLFLGNREDMGRLGRDFSELGVTHLLALSGLHLAVLYMGADKLLRAFRISARSRYTVSFAVIAFYTILTGFLMSVMRAALMLTIMFASKLSRRDSDGITSLFAALGIIILFDPTAVYDVSLQLSFFATLGILLMALPRRSPNDEWVGQTKALFRRAGRSILSSVSASFGAVLFIMPLQWLYFGEASVFAIPATLVLAPLCEGMLLLIPPYLICSLAGLSGLCGQLGLLMDMISAACRNTAAFMAEFSTPVSLRYPFTLPLILLTAAAIICMAVSRKFSSWLYSAIPFAVAAALFFGGVFVYNSIDEHRVTLDFKAVASGDALLAVSENKALIIDTTLGSRSLVWEACRLAEDRNITEIDTMLLTRLSRRQIGAVNKLLSIRTVKKLLIPMAEDEQDEYLIRDLCALCREYGTHTVLYDQSRAFRVTLGELTLSIPRRAYLPRSEVPLSLFHFSNGTDTLVYVGSSAWERAFLWSYTEEADIVVMGNAGPKLKEPPQKSPYEATKLIYILSEDDEGALFEWLSEYSGKIAYDREIRVEFD